MLSDIDIRRMVATGGVTISPFEARQLRPASYILRIGSKIALLDGRGGIVEPADGDTYPDLVETDIPDEGFVLEPNGFVLASTLECIGLGRDVGAILRNRTGLSRLGLSAEISSLISPGFGHDEPFPLTLELKNFSSNPIRIKSGLEICHCVFFSLTTQSSLGYDADVGAHSLRNSPSGSKFFKTLKR